MYNKHKPETRHRSILFTFGLPVCWNSIVKLSSSESVLTCVNHESRVEVILFGHWDVQLYEGGQVHFLYSD